MIFLLILGVLIGAGIVLYIAKNNKNTIQKVSENIHREVDKIKE